MSREAEIIDAVRDCIAAIGTPAFAVRIGVFNPAQLPPRTVAIAPLMVTRIPQGGGQQQWTLTVALVVRSSAGGASGEQHVFTRICDDARVIVNAIKTHAPLLPGGALNVLKVVRGETEYFYLAGTQDGQPGGAVEEVAFEWLE